MLGAMYEVVARYSVQDKGAGSQLDGITTKADNASKALGGVSGALLALGGGAALSVFGSLGKHLVQLNSEATESKIAVASLLTLNGLGTFENNMNRATKLTRDLRKAAKETKGEASDLINITSTVLPGIAGIAPSNSELVTFAKRATAASNVLLGSDYELGAQQLLQITSGQAGSDNRLFNGIKTPLMQELGIKSTGSKAVEEFNKIAVKDNRKTFDAVNKVLASFDDANNLLNKTIGGQIASLGDVANNILLTVGEPLTELLSGKLQEVNDWFEKNEDYVTKTAEAIGGKLTQAFEVFGDAAMYAAKNVDVLVASSAGLLAMKAFGAQNVITALSSWPQVLGARASAGIGTVGGGVASRLSSFNIGQRASAVGSAFVPMALRGTDNWAMSGLGGKAALTARFGAWRAGDALRRAPGALSRGAVDMFGLAGVVGDPRWGIASTGRRGLMVAQAGGAAARARAAGALGLTGMMGSDKWLLGTGLQRAGMVAGTSAAAIGGGVKGGLGRLFSAVGLSSVTTSLTALLRLAGPVGLAIGAVVGVMQVLQDETNAATGTFHDMVALLFKELDKLAGAFGFGAGEGGAAGMVKQFTTLLGEGLTNTLSFVIWSVAQLVKGLGFLAYVIEGISGGLGALYMQFEGAGGGMAGLKALDPSAAFKQGFGLADQRRDKMTADAEALERKRAEEARLKKLKEQDEKTAGDNKKPPVVHIKIEQKIETDASPERIAFAISDLLNDVFTNGRISVDRYT